MKYKLLQELLPYLESFEQSGSGDSINEFFHWMNNAPAVVSEPEHKTMKSVPLQGGINAKICQLIALMHKYVRFYYKKGLKDSLLQTTEDFGFLATLVTFGDLRKNELIQKNTSEFTSGMEVIRRLERHGLIESFLDKEDRRARRVQVTGKGRQTFFEVMPMLRHIGDIATGSLTDFEKQRLLELLEKLNIFHNPIFHNEKGAEIEEIVEQYVHD